MTYKHIINLCKETEISLLAYQDYEHLHQRRPLQSHSLPCMLQTDRIWSWIFLRCALHLPEVKVFCCIQVVRSCCRTCWCLLPAALDKTKAVTLKRCLDYIQNIFYVSVYSGCRGSLSFVSNCNMLIGGHPEQYDLLAHQDMVSTYCNIVCITLQHLWTWLPTKLWLW